MSSTFRGSLGAYFTPKPLCKFAVGISDIKEAKNIFDLPLYIDETPATMKYDDLLTWQKQVVDFIVESRTVFSHFLGTALRMEEGLLGW